MASGVENGGGAYAGRAILLSLAHPDDELGCVSLVSRYVAAGATATLICATAGDVGTVDAKYLQGYASIRELRLAELACATKAAGMTEVVMFDYRDSGMMGAPDNQNPESLWSALLDNVTARVADVMRRVRPDVVITFNTYGAYGHPDHIKINQATVAAFDQLQAEPDHPTKLYYLTLSGRGLRAVLRVLKLFGRDPRRLGRNSDMDLEAAVAAVTPITTRIRVGARDRARAREARRCHASQVTVPPVLDLLNRVVGPLIFPDVTLSRIIPASRPGAAIERDLFAGLPPR